MSPYSGNEDEMGHQDDGLSADDVEELLAGRLPANRHDLVGLAADLSSLRAEHLRAVDPVDVTRWARQAAATTRLTPTDKGDPVATPASNANRPALQVSGLPKRRISMIGSAIAFLSTTLGKTVAASALVAASATGGLAATDNLPGQSSDPVKVMTGTEPCDAGDPACSDAEVGDQDDAPEVEAPEVEVPEVEAPEVEAPEVEAPEVEAPEVEAPEVEAPEVEAPEVESPEVESPDHDTDDADEVEGHDEEVEAPEVESSDDDSDDADEVESSDDDSDDADEVESSDDDSDDADEVEDDDDEDDDGDEED